MDLPKNGYQYLNQFGEKNGKHDHSYQELGEYLELKAREKNTPISGKFELTPLCNFDCKMCYVHLDKNQMNGQDLLPIEVWKSLMHQAWEAGMMQANLTGGECLTYPGFKELYLYLQDLGCQVGVLTNGYLLDDNWIQFFQSHMPAVMQLTLYGWNDSVYERVTGHRCFTTVAENFKRALEANLPIYITITPSKYLGEDIFETIRVAKELSKNVMINTFYTTPREETGRSEQKDDVETELYIRAFKYKNQLEGIETIEINEADLPHCGGPSHNTSECGLLCGGGRSSFAIDWKGTLTPCTDLSIVRAYPIRDGFAAAWAKVNYEVNHWPRVPECIGCAYKDACNNCAANMLRFAEPGKQPTFLCAQTREYVRNGIKKLPECEK